jgi:MFS family permease
MAALTSRWMSGISPRWVFVVGIMPALATFWIRRAVPEPEEWSAAAKKQKPPPLGALFSRELWKATVLTTALTSIALTTVWAFLFFAPQAIRAIPEISAWTGPDKQRLVTNVTIVFLLVNICGNFFGTYFARRFGYRAAFAFMFLAALVCYLGLFRRELTVTGAYTATCLCAFFSLGVFGLFPMYIPRLYPTLVRTLGAGFTYNAGRLISGVGAYFGGVIAVNAGGPHKAIFWTGLLFIPGVVIALLCVVPKEEGCG